MRAFLFNHMHWLWWILHWLRHGIYNRWTLAMFLLLGVFQTAIGWEGAELAIMALPPDVSEVRKRRFKRNVRIFALFILIPTLYIGIDNDTNQRESDERAQRAEASAAGTQEQLGDMTKRAEKSAGSLDAFIKSVDLSKFTPTQIAQLMRAQRDNATVVSVPAPQTAPSGATGGSPSLPVPPAQQPQSKPVSGRSDANIRLRNEVQQEKDDLWKLDKSTADQAAAPMKEYSIEHRGAALSQDELRQALQNALKQRDTEFQRVHLPRLKDIRDEEKQVLSLNEGAKNREDVIFNTITAKVAPGYIATFNGTPVPVSAGPKYGEIEEWLDSLIHQLDMQAIGKQVY